MDFSEVEKQYGSAARDRANQAVIIEAKIAGNEEIIRLLNEQYFSPSKRPEGKSIQDIVTSRNAALKKREELDQQRRDLLYGPVSDADKAELKLKLGLS